MHEGRNEWAHKSWLHSYCIKNIIRIIKMNCQIVMSLACNDFQWGNSRTDKKLIQNGFTVKTCFSFRFRFVSTYPISSTWKYDNRQFVYISFKVTHFPIFLYSPAHAISMVYQFIIHYLVYKICRLTISVNPQLVSI